MALNKILKFAAGIGALVQSQAAYDVDTQRTQGNQPGLARASFVNKTLLQLSAVAAGVAQFLADNQATDVEDDLTPAEVSNMMGQAVVAVAEETIALAQLGHGKCYFDKSGANLVLTPLNGNGLIIDGVYQTIPSGGVACAPTGLAASTFYFIFAYMVGSTMMLEASTTGHSTSATTGVEIKTGDATRTLVGFGITAGAATWSSVATQVGSWFNRRKKTASSKFSANRSTSSTTYVEVSTEIRVLFGTWATEAVEVILTGTNRMLSAASGYTDSAVDGVGQEVGITTNSLGNVNFPFATYAAAKFTEASHYATLFGRTDAAATTQWIMSNTAPIINTQCVVTIMG